jgi:uncharacterized protein (TIGR02145 family)
MLQFFKIMLFKLKMFNKLVLLFLFSFLITGSVLAQKNDDEGDSAKTGTFTDKRDDRTYNWVRIGSQVWMSQNLAFKLKGGGYWAYNNNTGYVNQYGYLYAFVTAKTVCPKGWHLPNDEEWRQLTKFLGGEAIAGKKLKSTSGWAFSDSTKATNESGFTALPGGYRDGYGTYSSLKEIGFWWTSSAADRGVDYAWLRGMFFNNDYVSRFETFRPSGLSVRCVQNVKVKKGKNKDQEEEPEEELENLDQKDE